MASLEQERLRRERFAPELGTIVAHHILRLEMGEHASVHAEAGPGGLISVKARDLTVLARVRRHGPRGRYDKQFTVRTRGRGAGPAELQRICEGEGDYMLYAFADEADLRLAAWTLVDLAVFRETLEGLPYGGGDLIRARTRENQDGTAFAAFYWTDFPAAMIKAQSGVELVPRLL